MYDSDKGSPPGCGFGRDHGPVGTGENVRAMCRALSEIAVLLALVGVVACALAACQTADPAQQTPHTVYVGNFGGTVEVWTDTRGESGASQDANVEPTIEADVSGLPADVLGGE